MVSQLMNRFAAVAGLSDNEISLDEAALLIAAQMQNNIDINYYLSLIENLTYKFKQIQQESFKVSVNSLVEFIHGTEGFSGNISNYYDPENSYLNRVIERRRGIPISLALIHITLGKRLRIPVHGINFPQHFLICYELGERVIVDPFSGRLLSKTDCATLLRQHLGAKATLKDEYFARASNRDILMRLLDNLKKIFWQKKAWSHSKICIDHQLLLLPDALEFNVQLGAIYEMQGNLELAHHTYTNVLYQSTDKNLRQQISQRLLGLELDNRVVH
ncbi:MAG: transglutaminase-like domain-containing protein [Pseudomonadota bacterium]|nr:transglutaminase-like domain-containing protein [Pseudomonadota bacterium]